jgi:hypothetical protein
MHGEYLYPVLPAISVTAMMDAISSSLSPCSPRLFDTGDHWLAVTRKKSRARSWLDKCHLFLSLRPLTPTIRTRDNLRQMENLIDGCNKEFRSSECLSKMLFHTSPATTALHNMILLHQCLRIVAFLSPGSIMLCSNKLTNCNVNITCWRQFAATYLRRN